VGTQLPFDRLIRAADQVVGENGFELEVFGQIGHGSYRPRNFESVAFLEKEQFNKYMHMATNVISHAGVGTIIMALDSNKPLLVMPRYRKCHEVVNDHQVAIAREFEKLGHLLVAYRSEDFSERVQQLKTFVPQQRKNQAKPLVDVIAGFLDQLNYLKKGVGFPDVIGRQS
jgi:UDP-N-acetylglucosamine transferase subunit ALG13